MCIDKQITDLSIHIKENEMFNETETTINLVTPIDGVEIAAYYDEVSQQWICNDGFNTYQFSTVEEARANLTEAVEFYS